MTMRFYLAMLSENEHVEYIREADVVRDLACDLEPTPYMVLLIDLADGTAKDVSEEIAEMTANEWLSGQDEDGLENGSFPQFCQKRIDVRRLELWREDALQNIRDEKEHVRAISSPQLMGR